ncbi:MAG: alpha/beta fold hydrolase [Chloroflexales bacterium]|nr:alpha/beta fold hydrolase [Chloroflexales bacterium]
MPTVAGVFYAVRGAGQPVVCLHGAGGSHTHWGHLLVGLADRARVFAPDLPGHGRSAPPAPATISGCAEATLALLDDLGLERAVLVGHSMGAAAAIEAALSAPARVVGLALVGAAARLRVAPALLADLAADPAAAIEQLVAMMYPECSAHMRGPAVAEYRRDPATLRADFMACDGWDARPRLAALACPALVVCGEADVMTPPKLAAELAGLIAGARLALLPAVGHAPMLEAPAATVAELRAWLERVA